MARKLSARKVAERKAAYDRERFNLRTVIEAQDRLPNAPKFGPNQAAWAWLENLHYSMVFSPKDQASLLHSVAMGRIPSDPWMVIWPFGPSLATWRLQGGT